MPGNLLIRNVRPMGGAPVDLDIRDGIIAQIGPSLAINGPEGETIDGQNGLLFPGLVDGHMHLDKTFVGLPWVPHEGDATITGKIEADKRVHARVHPSVEEQAKRLIRLCVSQGTTTIRSHVDIDPELGLSRLEGVVAAREAMAGAVTVQLVAFPQSGVMRRRGTAELLERALKSGADLIGGVDPAGVDEDAKGQLDAIFAIAERNGVGVDIHLHDPGELGVHQVNMIIDRVQHHGLAGQVVISHAYCLGDVNEARMRGIAERLRENSIAIMTTGASHCPVPPLPLLHEVGVTVFAGSDGVRDPWTPFGNADQLERAMLVAQRFNFRDDDGLRLAFRLVAHDGAQGLHLQNYGLEPGCAGDVVLVNSENIPEAVVSRPPRALVVKAGRIVARDGAVQV